jgi:hypothetical protein
MSLSRTGDAAGKQGLVKMNHLYDFVADVRCPSNTVHAGHEGCRSNQNITHTHFAAAIALAMVSRKSLHQLARLIKLAVQKDAFVGNKHILQDQHDLLPAKGRIAHVEIGPSSLRVSLACRP